MNDDSRPLLPESPPGRDPYAVPVPPPPPETKNHTLLMIVALVVIASVIAVLQLAEPGVDARKGIAVIPETVSPGPERPITQKELDQRVQSIANHVGKDGPGAYAFMTARLAETTGCTVENAPYAVAVPIQKAAAVKATRATGSEVVTFEEKWKIDQKDLRGLRKDFPDVMHAEAWAPILDKDRYGLPGPGGWRVLVYVALDCP